MTHLEQLDRRAGWRVPTSVTRSLCTAALALVAACGGPDKGAATTPAGNPGPGVAGDPANMDPDGYEPGATDVEGGDPGAGGEPGGDGGEVGGDDAGEPALRPPGVDLSPEEQARAVAKHVAAARQALGGATPDPDRAITEAEQALAADETSVEAMVLLAHANYVKGYHDLAEDILTKAFERGGKQSKEAHFLLGLVYERTERKDKAPAEYLAALAIDPNYRSALINLGVHHLANKRYADAVQVYERLTGDLGVNTPVTWTNLGSAYRGLSVEYALSDTNRRNQLLLAAERAYRRAISLAKNYALAYYNLGILYLDADPFPQGDGDMDRLARLRRAKTYFDEYRRLPGADQKLVDQTAATAQKLIDREELLRKRQAEREAKRRAAEEQRKNQPAGSDDGFE